MSPTIEQSPGGPSQVRRFVILPDLVWFHPITIRNWERLDLYEVLSPSTQLCMFMCIPAMIIVLLAMITGATLSVNPLIMIHWQPPPLLVFGNIVLCWMDHDVNEPSGKRMTSDHVNLACLRKEEEELVYPMMIHQSHALLWILDVRLWHKTGLIISGLLVLTGTEKRLSWRGSGHCSLIQRIQIVYHHIILILRVRCPLTHWFSLWFKCFSLASQSWHPWPPGCFVPLWEAPQHVVRMGNAGDPNLTQVRRFVIMPDLTMVYIW